MQEEFNAVSSELKKYNPRNSASNDEKLRLLNNSKNFMMEERWLLMHLNL